jgi:hypothetical protein
MRDHFALGESLLEVFFNDSTIPLVVNSDASKQSCYEIYEESVDLREQEHTVKNEKNTLEVFERRLTGKLLRIKNSKKNLETIISSILDYCSVQGINVPNEVMELKDLLDNTKDPTLEILNKIKDFSYNFLEREGDEVRSLEKNLKVKKVQSVEKRKVALEAVCNHYPNQVRLIKALAGMSTENLSKRTSIRKAMRSAFPEEIVREVEKAPGADFKLLSNRIRLAHEAKSID